MDAATRRPAIRPRSQLNAAHAGRFRMQAKAVELDVEIEANKSKRNTREMKNP